MEEQLEQLSYAQSALIGVGIAAFYYFFVYAVTNPESVIKESEQQVVEANTEIEKVDALIREKQELEAELLKNEELVKSSVDVVPTELSTDTALEKLTTKARSYGLSIDSIGTFSEWTTDTQFARSKLNIGLKGTFGQLMFFLSDFTREEGFYSFKGLKLGPVGTNSTEKTDDLEIGMTVEVLKRISAEEKEISQAEGAF